MLNSRAAAVATHAGRRPQDTAHGTPGSTGGIKVPPI